MRRFPANRDGNFLILFALLLVPMLGLLGIAVDYALIQRTKTALDASVDAAVLAAATTAEEVIQAQSTANYDATPAAIQYGKTMGQQVFQANSATLNGNATPTLTLNLQRQGMIITATGSYKVHQPTVLGKMFGVTTMNASGAATSNLSLPTYKNIYVAVDISQSMGIAATQTAMNQLASLTGGCVFGCHVYENGQTVPDQTTPYETVAHRNGIDLRIDVIRSSIQNIISSAQTNGGAKPMTAIALYTMQHNIATVMGPSTNYNSLTSASNAIDLGPNDPGGTGDSELKTSLTSFAPMVPASGDGSSSSTPLNFVFIMTDGVSDIKGSCTDGHCTSAFDASACAAFKNKNIIVGVIYTTYIPFPNEQTYRDLVQPFQSNIGPNLQACASPGYYYEASDGPAIQAAAQKLTAQALAQGRLTQ